VGVDDDLEQRASRHAALGEPVRLAIVEELLGSDRAPVELTRRLGLSSNLLAHHLDVLERVGLIERSRSSGDGRRRYVHLRRSVLEEVVPGPCAPVGPTLFVCTANSARSQLAAGLWRDLTGTEAQSAGTHPAATVHPGAVGAAERAGVDLSGAVPRSLADIEVVPSLVVTVCDRAHEELDPSESWWHWSVPDPVAVGTDEAFDATVAELRGRVLSAAGRVGP
jgi:protein-tyrosine-phosphatase